jgi:hypothetical protein
MQLQKIKVKDLPEWPPIWAGISLWQPEEGVLQNVEVIPGTKFLRLDVEHAQINFPGLIIPRTNVRRILFRKLKNNIGRQLADIGDLEINV